MSTSTAQQRSIYALSVKVTVLCFMPLLARGQKNRTRKIVYGIEVVPLPRQPTLHQELEHCR